MAIDEKHSAYCLELLNEIHANRAVRHLTGGKHFTTQELVEICVSIGDRPDWTKANQAWLVDTELAIMAQIDPYIADME